MISYIKGTLEYISDGFLIVEAGGIGYKINVSSKTLSDMPQLKNEVKIFTYMSVKEDGIALFGFTEMEELELFNKLITVSGLGPKTALGVLSFMSVSDLILAIISDDIKTLGKAPGIGPKTAKRMVLELKDKLSNEDFIIKAAGAYDMSPQSIAADSRTETIEALTALGYNRTEAVRAVGAVYYDGADTESLLKLALKKMAIL